jgi:predicted DNA-binding transcriptional regulator YafY
MKLDRLLGILTVLLQNDRMTAPELAEKFEVSRRTIGRDIDSLCMAGIPRHPSDKPPSLYFAFRTTDCAIKSMLLSDFGMKKGARFILPPCV